MVVDREQLWRSSDRAIEMQRYEALVELRGGLQKAIEGGEPREKILQDLEGLRVEIRESGEPGAASVDDVILEMMDFVTGWCSPHMRA